MTLGLQTTLLMLLSTSFGSLQAQESTVDWEVVVDEGGILVERRERASSPMPVFRGTSQVDVRWDHVLAFLNDVESNHEWMYGCMESRILRRGGLGEFLVYHRTAAPWPLWDRDVLIQTRLVNHRDGSFEVRLTSVTDALHPPLKDVVRMPRLIGSYKLWPQGERTAIAFEIDVEPGGTVPIWLVKLVSRNLPLRTLQNLRKRVVDLAAQGRYRQSASRFYARFEGHPSPAE